MTFFACLLLSFPSYQFSSQSPFKYCPNGPEEACSKIDWYVPCSSFEHLPHHRHGGRAADGGVAIFRTSATPE